MTDADDARAHALPLPGGDWEIWRTTCLRGAGFPASFVLRLAATDAAAAADRRLDLEAAADTARRAAVDALRRAEETATGDEIAALRKAGKNARKGRPPPDTGTTADVELRTFRAAAASAEAAAAELHGVYESSRARVFRAAQAVASDVRLREAVLWQNRGALHNGFAPFLRADANARSSKSRQQEELVASYLQRYCTKNDSIGFFGPIGWGRFAPDGERAVARPGPTLTAARRVYFEQWAIDALASKLAADARYERWLVPRRLPFVRVDGATAHSAESGRQPLTLDEATILLAIDGRRTARELAQALAAADPRADRSEGQVFTILRTLRERRLATWTLELPLGTHPDRTLRAALAHVADEALRNEALAPLAELDAARNAVRDGAGDLDRLEEALVGLDATFTRVTGAAPTRAAGSMYAARQVVYEDCRRDLDLTFGPALLEAVGPALSLVLASARWLSYEGARAYEAALYAIHADVRRRSKDGVVRFSDVWLRAPRIFLGAKERPAEACLAAIVERWTTILAVPEGAARVRRTSAELQAAVQEAFAAPHPGWIGARHHSPDLMLVAESIEAVQRGDFEAVLGEIHVGCNTLTSACFFDQHPDPPALQAMFGRDVPEPLPLPLFHKGWPKVTVRTNRTLVGPASYYLEAGEDRAPGDRDRVLSLSDLVVEDREGTLVVHDGRSPPIAMMEFFADAMTLNVMNGLRFLPRSAHTPRVTIDRLVVCRESWTFTPSELSFADEKDEEARFVATRRWARAKGLPRFFFVKSVIEVKPQFVDLDSPVFLNVLAKVVRRTRDHVAGETPLTVTEMLPGLDETWLPDAAGERYTAEMRIVVVDPARPPAS